jgi:hypothetical protein
MGSSERRKRDTGPAQRLETTVAGPRYEVHVKGPAPTMQPERPTKDKHAEAITPIESQAAPPVLRHEPVDQPRLGHSQHISPLTAKLVASLKPVNLPFWSPKVANSHHPDAGDESLQRYKQSLGLGGGTDLSDPNDLRVCIIHSLEMNSDGRAPVTIDLSVAGSENTLKNKPFKIKEGVKFTMTATFKVQHEILSGLHYVQSVKRAGIRVSKEDEMIVCVLGDRPLDIHETLTPSRAAMLPTPTSHPSTPRSVSFSRPPFCGGPGPRLYLSCMY